MLSQDTLKYGKDLYPITLSFNTFHLRSGGKEGMAGEMEPAEDMDQTEPDSTVGEIFD